MNKKTSLNQGLLRSIVISRMGALGHEGTVAEARRRFSAHLEGEEVIPADLRAPVYRVVAANGDAETYNQMVKLFKQADLHEEKDRIGEILTSRDAASIKLCNS